METGKIFRSTTYPLSGGYYIIAGRDGAVHVTICLPADEMLYLAPHLRTLGCEVAGAMLSQTWGAVYDESLEAGERVREKTTSFWLEGHENLMAEAERWADAQMEKLERAIEQHQAHAVDSTLFS